MKNVTDLLLSQLGEGGLNKLAEQAGGSKEQVKTAVEGSIPVLLNAISQNTKTQEGANNFLSALDRDHDGSMLDNIGEHLQNPSRVNGEGILNHILGSKKTEVENQLASSSGLKPGGVSKILQMVAPLLMGFLGQQKKKLGGALNAGNISGILSSLGSGKGLDISSMLSMAGGGAEGAAKSVLGKVTNMFGK